MHVLVINGGSSSVKFSIFEVDGGAARSEYEGEASGIGTEEAEFKFGGSGVGGSGVGEGEHPTLSGEARKDGAPAGGEARTDGGAGGEPELTSMHGAIEAVVQAVGAEGIPEIGAVGYRVVHPGARMKGHHVIDESVLRQLKEAVEFAPLHDPAAIEIIETMMKKWPGVPHVACFDTVFHETMPDAVTTYSLPAELRAKGIKRYGFHGLSCESVVEQMRRGTGLPPGLAEARLVIAHLGSGCSVSAVVGGRSADNSMGMTPTGGVVMGTRPGDLDPGVVLYLLRQPGATVESVETLLNRQSGLKGLDGRNDMREVAKAARDGDQDARLGLEVFRASVRRAIGGMMALHGMDALVFTGGIGEHDAETRAAIGDGLGAGVVIDAAVNADAGKGLRRVSGEGTGYAVYVVPAEENWVIARHVAAMV